MEGLLEKLTNNKLGLNYYQKRHFRLEWSKLKYFARPEDDQEKGAINLAEMHGAYLSDEDAQRKTIVLLFGNRSIFLLAPDPEEAAAWVYNLRSYTKRVSSNDPVPLPRHIARSLLVLISSCKKHGGAQQEGLFRVPGRASEIKSICRSVYLNRSTILTPDEARDVESTAGAIKRLLWCLPEPLFTKTRVEPMIKAQTAERIRELILEMPLDNRVVIKNLFGLLKEVCDNTASTKMTPLSLAMCFSPCLSGAETGAILEMKALFTLLIGEYDDIFRDIPMALESDDALTTNIVDCLPKTSSARAITAVLAENGGDIQATLKRKSQQVWDSFRPRSMAATSKPASMKPRPSIPSFIETKPQPSATTSIALASTSSLLTPAADADLDDGKVPPRIQKQLDHLRNRVQELEERCAYWRNKAEAAEAALAAVKTTATMQPLPRKSLVSAPTNNLVIRTSMSARGRASQSDDEISSEDGLTTDDDAYRTALPELGNESKTDEEISELSDDDNSTVAMAPAASIMVAPSR